MQLFLNMKRIKQYWKEILIGILVLFGMNKCTQSCNRQTIINKQCTELNKLDSTILLLKADTLKKAHRIEVLIEQINTANEKVNVAVSKSETAKANEETAKAKAEKAKAERDAARARAISRK